MDYEHLELIDSLPIVVKGRRDHMIIPALLILMALLLILSVRSDIFPLAREDYFVCFAILTPLIVFFILSSVTFDIEIFEDRILTKRTLLFIIPFYNTIYFRELEKVLIWRSCFSPVKSSSHEELKLLNVDLVYDLHYSMNSLSLNRSGFKRDQLSKIEEILRVASKDSGLRFEEKSLE